MTQPDSKIAELTRAVIAEKIGALLIRERELTERLALMFKNGQCGGAPVISDHERNIHQVAQQALNGAGSLLEPLRKDESEASINVQREGVRLALRTLQRADTEKHAIEVAEKAVRLTPEWNAIAKEWTLAALRWQAIEARAQAFKEAAGPDVTQALPRGDLAVGNGARIDLNAFDGWNFAVTADDVADAAITAGFLTRSDVDRAKRGRGDA
jgi:hypothetical protein